jgi:hypothetical protein
VHFSLAGAGPDHQKGHGMFIHPTTALELAAQRRLDDERLARIRMRPLSDSKNVRPVRRG